MCHSARLAQRNLPAKHESARKGLNKKSAAKEGRNILEISIFKVSIIKWIFFRNKKTAILTEKGEKVRTTANLVENSRTLSQKNEASYRDNHAR